MAFERDFLDLMPHTFTVRKFGALSTDGYGVRSAGSSYAVRGLLVQKRTLVRALDGREVVSTSTAHLSPLSTTSGSVVVDPQDQLVLPAGFTVAGSSAPPVIAVERYEDDDGHHSTAVYL